MKIFIPSQNCEGILFYEHRFSASHFDECQFKRQGWNGSIGDAFDGSDQCDDTARRDGLGAFYRSSLDDVGIVIGMIGFYFFAHAWRVAVHQRQTHRIEQQFSQQHHVSVMRFCSSQCLVCSINVACDQCRVEFMNDGQ